MNTSNKIFDMTACRMCPRECGADRASGKRGYCGEGSDMRVAKIMLHMWEEPCLTGDGSGSRRGCGAIFFTGCPLRCVYCQNMKISRGAAGGQMLSPGELSDVMLKFERDGAAVIDLVTPTHFIHGITAAVSIARERGLTLPVVYNTGGYEKAETIRAAGEIDIYLTDFKYASAGAGELSRAPDYCERAAEALREMLMAQPEPVIGSDGIMRRGVIVRHLVLPGLRRDSAAVLREIRRAEEDTGGKVLLSLMRQYTPVSEIPGAAETASVKLPPHSRLSRRVTSFEYEYVADAAREMGFDGYFQGKDSAVSAYTPEF